MPPAQPADQEARQGRPIPKSSIASLSPVSLPPTIQHSAFHAENAGPVNFSDRLRIADVRPSIHFIADDFLRVALKPACALLPLPTRRPDQDEKQSTARNGWTPLRADIASSRSTGLRGATCVFTLASYIGFFQLDHGPHVF